MTNPKNEGCGWHCKYWHQFPAMGDSHGLCQRFPPSIEDKEVQTPCLRFPVTAYENWCGEYKKKEVV